MAKNGIVFFGVEWELGLGRRGLPVQAALAARRVLLAFARSRGPQSLSVWQRVVGVAGWIAMVASVDPTRRLGMLGGLRAAQHCARGVVPGRRARSEARRHAAAAMRWPRIDAPAERTFFPLEAARLSDSRTWLVADAAAPGASAVVAFAPGRAPSLVHWERVAPGTAAVTAELRALAAAAEHVRVERIERPVLVTDCRSVWHMVRRGVARNPAHHRAIRAIREAADETHVVWVPSAENLADGPSRAESARDAENYIRVTGAHWGRPKPGPTALAYGVRRRAPPPHRG